MDAEVLLLLLKKLKCDPLLHCNILRVSASRTTADDRGDSYTLGGGKRKKAGKATNTLGIVQF